MSEISLASNGITQAAAHIADVLAALLHQSSSQIQADFDLNVWQRNLALAKAATNTTISALAANGGTIEEVHAVSRKLDLEIQRSLD